MFLPNTNIHQNSIEKQLKISADYSFEILSDMVAQSQGLIFTNYFDIVQKNNISQLQRGVVIEWMIEVSDGLHLSHITKNTAVLIFDLMLSKVQIPTKKLQLLGITTLLLGIKQEESNGLPLSHASAYCQGIYTPAEIAKMEVDILKNLKWKLIYPLPGDLARRFALATQLVSEYNAKRIFKLIDDYIDLCLYDFPTASYGPLTISIVSTICALNKVNMGAAIPNFLSHINSVYGVPLNQIVPCYNRVSEVLGEAMGPGSYIQPMILSYVEQQFNNFGTKDINKTMLKSPANKENEIIRQSSCVTPQIKNYSNLSSPVQANKLLGYDQTTDKIIKYQDKTHDMEEEFGYDYDEDKENEFVN